MVEADVTAGLFVYQGTLQDLGPTRFRGWCCGQRLGRLDFETSWGAVQ